MPREKCLYKNLILDWRKWIKVLQDLEDIEERRGS